MTRRESDVKDCWVENKDDEPKYIKEGDLVLLHNWGMDNGDQIIGVAVLFYDSEYHAWNFSMVAGNYVEDIYDRWRQNPRVIGKVKYDQDVLRGDFSEDMYVEMEITDEDYKKWNCKWNDLIDYSRFEADKKFHLKERRRVMKKINIKKKELQDELDKIKLEEDKINQEMKKIRKQSLSDEILTEEQAEKVEEILQNTEYYFDKHEEENIKYINEEVEDDCFLHIKRKGWDFVFYNGQDGRALEEEQLPKYVKIVEKAIKECDF